MHNSGIISHVMKIMEFHVSVVLREATKIQYIIHFICASCMLIFRRGGVPGDVLWQRSLLPGGGEL